MDFTLGTKLQRQTDKLYLRYLNRTTKEPFRRMREWANSGTGQIRRHLSLAQYARQKQESAPSQKTALKWKELRYGALARAKHLWLEAHPPTPVDTDGLTWFDGHQVASWIVHEVLIPARNSGVWGGGVISGYRSDAYQCTVCSQICSGGCQNGCPGLCARPGTSNHRGIVKPAGAADVSDPAGLQRWCRAHGNPMHGNGEMLPYDIPHFSASGR